MQVLRHTVPYGIGLAVPTKRLPARGKGFLCLRAGGHSSPCLEGQGLPTFTSRLSCFTGDCSCIDSQSYIASTGMTFPEPQGSSQSDKYRKRGFCFLIRSLVFTPGSRKSGDIGETR